MLGYWLCLEALTLALFILTTSCCGPSQEYQEIIREKQFADALQLIALTWITW